MKRYLLVDTLTDYKTLNNEKELKELLVELVGNDTRTNSNVEEIVLNNVKIFEELAKENVSMNYIQEKLEEFCYKIIDLEQLIRDLEDTKEYFNNNNKLVEKTENEYIFNRVLEVLYKGAE